MLCADLFVSLNGAWTKPGALDGDALSYLPAHKKGSATTPAGGNENFADGSVAWFNSLQMVNLYSATGVYQYNFYFHQDDWGPSAGFTPKAGP